MANVINGTTTNALVDVVTLAPLAGSTFVRVEGAVQNTGAVNTLMALFRSTDLLGVIHLYGVSLEPGKAVGFDTFSLGVKLPVTSFTVAVQSLVPGLPTAYRMTGEQF